MDTDLQEFDEVVLRSFFTNDRYMRQVVPYIELDYFENENRVIFKNFVKYVAKYNARPSLEEFKITCREENSLSSEVCEKLDRLFRPVEAQHQWLIDKTESWCKYRAIFNAIVQSVDVVNGNHDKLTTGVLPELFTKALAVSFDPDIGHDYTENAEDRFEYYHRVEQKIPFDLEIFNLLTKGGLSKKTLTIFMAGPAVGKSQFMCHMAASTLSLGKNVLYISMEMSEEDLGERIDANLFDMSSDKIESMSKSKFMQKIDDIKQKTTGKLIIKQYPTSQAHAGHFRSLLNELKLKKEFEPDMIILDYLNICASSRFKAGAKGSYETVKGIAEEVRGLAVEFNVPIVSATQFNREGFSSSDPGMEHTSESFGLPATCDWMYALMTDDILEEQGLLRVKQLKNRYSKLKKFERFTIGIDRSKCKFFDVDQDWSDPQSGNKEQDVAASLGKSLEQTKNNLGGLIV